MRETLLSLGFKGERSYLQGPDIFNETLAWLSSHQGEIQDIDFSFHRLAHRQLRVVMGGPHEVSQPVAACSFTARGTRGRAYLLETDSPVTARCPYPEDEIVRSMAVDSSARRGVLPGGTRYSNIEVWVAMTKALHLRIFPQRAGKWLFVRGRFAKYDRHSAANEHALAIVACFTDRFTRSEISLDGEKAGEIYFAITAT